MRPYAKLLKELSDREKYTQEEIFNNLRDCLKGEKGCIFTCGRNLAEHIDRYDELINGNFFISVFKHAIQELNFFVDAVFLCPAMLHRDA